MKKHIKIIKKIAYVVMATLVFTTCQDLDMPPYGDYEIDPSIVTINYPLEGAAIKVYDDPASIDIEIEVHDDHLVREISVALNGTEIANLTDFIDPRNIIETVTYNGLVIGDYVLTVTSTDVDGTSSSAEVNFTKEPPYTPELDGEILYMPFDGDYQEQVTGNLATQVGTPGFAGSGHDGSNAYQGAPDSYLTLPSAGLLNPEFSATFWLKIDPSDTRSGIINIAPAVPTGPADKTSGFGLIREGDATSQKFILLVGNGTGTSWVNPGAPATIDPRLNQWVHFGITISETTASLYMDGELVGQSDGGFTGIDWTGVEDLVIMSGDPNFNGWDHKTEKGQMDELRIFNKALTAEDIQNMAGPSIPYIPQYPGESFYMPFEDNYVNLIGNVPATLVGSPEITTDAHEGSGAYAGATDSYLTYPADGLTTSQFSASMWIKLNDVPDRAGILTISPEDLANGGYPDIQNNRSSGFRLFREDVGGNQVLKLNIGTGGDNWFDGGAAASLPVGEWAHVAISMGASQAAVYINGVVVSSGSFPGLDWTGCDLISIMSGAPRFNEWGHKSDLSYLDDLRLFNRALSAGDVAAIYGGEVYFGSTAYMPFDGDNVDRVAEINPIAVGTPSFAGEAAVGSDAYAGATDSYLTIPTTGLTGSSFSAAMWYKLDATPDRAGILAISPEDLANGGYPDIQNNRTSGLRLFREDVGGNQVLKLNIGTGSDNWFDGGAAAAIPPGEWAHLAISIGPTNVAVYINGVVVSSGTISGLDWTGCDLISIMSGAPRFNEWGHKSDLSYLDDLYLFDKALTQAEIQAIMLQ